MKKNLSVILAVLMMISFASVVFAGAQDNYVKLNPSSEGKYSSWGVRGGCTLEKKWECVSKDSRNDTTDLIYANINALQTFKFERLDIDKNSRINSVTLYMYSKKYNQDKYKMQPVFLNSTKIYYAPIMRQSPTYRLIAYQFHRNPLTKLNWTTEDINAIDAGFATIGSNGGAMVSQMYLLVNYTRN